MFPLLLDGMPIGLLLTYVIHSLLCAWERISLLVISTFSSSTQKFLKLANSIKKHGEVHLGYKEA